MLPLLLALACAKPAPLPDEPLTTRVTSEVDGLRAELVTEGPLSSRVLSDDGADLVLLYGTEEGGSLDPCGCQDRPRGGLPRLAAYRDAVQAADPDLPVLLLNAGGWLSAEANLDGSPRADIPHRNRWMSRGMAALQPTALNIAASELRALDQRSGDPPPLPLVSAHLRDPDGLVQPWLAVQAGDLRVGITGIGAPGPRWMAPEGWNLTDPEQAARQVIQAHRDQVDLVVLLAHALPEVARDLAQDGLVDVVVDAWTHRTFTAPFRVGDAVWVRAHFQTMRAGELRLQVDDGRVSQALERKIDLDEALEPDAELQELADQARRELRELERLSFGRSLR